MLRVPMRGVVNTSPWPDTDMLPQKGGGRGVPCILGLEGGVIARRSDTSPSAVAHRAQESVTC